MHALRLKYQNIDKEKRIYFWTFLISLLIHLFFLLLFTRDLLIIDLSPEEKDRLPEEVTVLFPENKPKTVVENMNENDAVPQESDLLSDRNSQATNPEMLERMANQPFIHGNQPLPNLTMPYLQQLLRNQSQAKKFSKDALVGRQDNPALAQNDQTGLEQQSKPWQQPSTNNIYDQDKFSANKLGDAFSLSTYAWEWAPYLNALKQKLYQVWHTPAAYHRLGLIHGQTDILFSISRDGELLSYKVLDHVGHESLETSSVNAIVSCFPFKPLPDNFPDKTLTITARLIYPDLRRSY